MFLKLHIRRQSALLIAYPKRDRCTRLPWWRTSPGVPPGLSKSKAPLLIVLSIALCLWDQPAGAGQATRESPLAEKLECLALTMYWEAGNESRQGLLAVGWVVFNRRAHPEFPPTICGVVQQGGERSGCQFRYWCDDKSNTPEHKTQWARALATALHLLAMPTTDPTNGALFFHGSNLERAPWKIPRQQTTTIGNHVFYR